MGVKRPLQKKKKDLKNPITNKSETSSLTSSKSVPPSPKRKCHNFNDSNNEGNSSTQPPPTSNARNSAPPRASAIITQMTLDSTRQLLRAIKLSQPAVCSRFSPIQINGTSFDRSMINTKITDDKKIVMNKLLEIGSKFFTFTDSDEKPSTYVLKGFVRVEPPELKETLINIGLPILNVSFLNNSLTYPSYVVSFQRLEVDLIKLQHQYKIVDSVRVSWQRFDRAKKNITQCHKCQEFGHIAKNCNQLHRCCKCLTSHPIGKENCSRQSRDEGTPKCVNCKGDHASNFKDCPARLQYVEKVTKMRNNRTAANQNSSASRTPQRQQNQFNFNPSAFPKIVNSLEAVQVSLTQNSTVVRNSNQSYANVTSQGNNLQARLDKIQNFSKVEAKFEAFIRDLEACKGNEDEMFEIMISYRASRIPKPTVSINSKQTNYV